MHLFPQTRKTISFPIRNADGFLLVEAPPQTIDIGLKEISPEFRGTLEELRAEDEGFEFRYLCPLVVKTPFLVSLSSDIFL